MKFEAFCSSRLWVKSVKGLLREKVAKIYTYLVNHGL